MCQRGETGEGRGDATVHEVRRTIGEHKRAHLGARRPQAQTGWGILLAENRTLEGFRGAVQHKPGDEETHKRGGDNKP